MTSRTCRRCEISKKADLEPYPYGKKYTTFSFPIHGALASIICLSYALYILMYSALHIMQWFSHILDVFTPKIRRNFFDFYILWIKTNVAYTRLELIARTKHCTTTTASNWFVTSYYKLLPAVRYSSKHGRRRSSLLLYSISMVKSCSEHGRSRMYFGDSSYPHPVHKVLQITTHSRFKVGAFCMVTNRILDQPN